MTTALLSFYCTPCRRTRRFDTIWRNNQLL